MPGGNGNQGGSGTMNMPECDPCTMPNPPSSCDDEELFTLTTNVTPSYAGVVSPSSGQYQAGTQVTLSAQVNSTHSEGYVFSHWSGDVSGSQPTITFEIEQNTIATAEYIKVCDSSNAPEWCDNKCENTGNELVDDLSDRGMLNWAWESSNFGNLNQSERKEGFYAIFEENGIFSKQMLPFSNQTSCSFRISFGTVSIMNAFLNGAVYLLHTQPYDPGELINDTICLEVRNWDVEKLGIPEYRPGPSQMDLSAMNFMGLPLITIDTQNIYVSAVGDTLPSQAAIFTRCGY